MHKFADINRIADNFTKDGGQPRLVKAALNMVANWPGGLAGLLDAFREKGMGAMVDSWLDGGANEPVSVEELRNILGAQQIDNLAKQAGISPDDTAFQLSSMLPDLISGLTPQGDVPNQDATDRRIRLIRDRLKV